MNDLERLLADSRPAGPSDELDDRVRRALAEIDLRGKSVRDDRSWRTLALAVAASALVAAGVGFLAGRATAGSASSPGPSDVVLETTDDDGAASDRVETDAPDKPNRTTIPLPDDRLAALFIQGRPREGMLGAGPVTVEISRTP